MKYFEDKLNDFIASIPPEFHAIHEKAEQLKRDFELTKGMPETALSLFHFYIKMDSPDMARTWAIEIAEENYERVHLESKGVKYDVSSNK